MGGVFSYTPTSYSRYLLEIDYYSRVLIVGDMNMHSPIWNPYCHQRQNAGLLEEPIEIYELFVNNNTDFPTRPESRGRSIIDLALTSPGLGLLHIWEIPEVYPILSNHELIL